MTRVVALQAWSNGSITMEEKQIADLQDALAAELIAQGIVAPTALPAITPDDAGKVLTANDSGVWVAQNPSSGGGVLVVTGTYIDRVLTLDKTWQEIHDAFISNGAVISIGDGEIFESTLVTKVTADSGVYQVVAENAYTASSASGYPALT